MTGLAAEHLIFFLSVLPFRPYPPFLSGAKCWYMMGKFDGGVEPHIYEQAVAVAICAKLCSQSLDQPLFFSFLVCFGMSLPC